VWQRLANAYRVLGETAKAEEATKRGAEAQARAGGAATQASSSAAPGPTAHDVAAAAGMKPEERQAMVRSMVEGLAAKLEKNPDDAAGWQRLSRAWRVLGEDAKADDAAAKAAALRPNDPEIPLDQARTIIDNATRTQGPSAPVPDKAVALMQRAAELDPKQPEALWYLGLAEAQRGKKKEAADYWQRLLQVLPPGSEDHKTVRAAIDALKPVN
jgi:cytochrome c-type biogenesis protein CcmH